MRPERYYLPCDLLGRTSIEVACEEIIQRNRNECYSVFLARRRDTINKSIIEVEKQINGTSLRKQNYYPKNILNKILIHLNKM